jgi:hypothetical protein
MTSGLATLTELDTVYGLEDAYLLLEVSSVNNINRRIAAQPEKQ